MPSALAASFGDGPGLELLAARASRSGASLIEVAHFSGVMTLSAHLAAYRALVALVIADYTAVQNDAQLSADVQRLLATVGNPQATPSQLAQDRQTVANDLQRLVDAVLQPAADKAVDGLLAFFASERLYLDFEARRVLLLAHDPDLGDVVGLHADGTRGENPVAAVAAPVLSKLQASSDALYVRYDRVAGNPESCSGEVISLDDWVVKALVLYDKRLAMGLEADAPGVLHRTEGRPRRTTKPAVRRRRGLDRFSNARQHRGALRKPPEVSLPTGKSASR